MVLDGLGLGGRNRVLREEVVVFAVMVLSKRTQAQVISS